MLVYQYSEKCKLKPQASKLCSQQKQLQGGHWLELERTEEWAHTLLLEV